MHAEIARVRLFHEQIGASIADQPCLLPALQTHCAAAAGTLRHALTQCQRLNSVENVLISRLCLELEELAEWVEAHAKGDLVAAADAWGDRAYVLLGDAVAAGMPADAIFAEVHASNMTKAVSRTTPAGKAVKSDSFRAPKFEAILSNT